jgi:hypothetical protein
MKRARTIDHFDTIDALLTLPEHCLDRTASGPRAIVKSLQFEKLTMHQRCQWRHEATRLAILGPFAKSLPSLRSGVKCYIAFAGVLLSCILSLWVVVACSIQNTGKT